jgi:hypothetical protein
LLLAAAVAAELIQMVQVHEAVVEQVDCFITEQKHPKHQTVRHKQLQQIHVTLLQ